MQRTILHVDLDAFFCSVEELLDPSLTGRPFAVGGQPGQRGVISSASYAARAFGVRSAMPTAQALRLCPDLVLVSPRHGMYGEHSERVMSLLREAAPVVEQLSIDEAFLDVSDDPRPGSEIAAHLKSEIRLRHKLPTSWGVASNKLVAKIATEVGKPDGLVAVPGGREGEFLAPLPVQMLWGVGPKTQQVLAAEGIKTIGDIARWPAHRLQAAFGERGPELASTALGVDTRPVVAEHQPKSLSAERTFARDIHSQPALEAVLVELVEEVGQRLREHDLAGSTVRLKLRWSDFTTILRQASLPQPSSVDPEILGVVRALFQANWKPGRPVRLLGVGVSGLQPPVRQLDLFDRTWEREERLLRAVDQIRQRFGDQSVHRASSLRRVAPVDGESPGPPGDPPYKT